MNSENSPPVASNFNELLGLVFVSSDAGVYVLELQLTPEHLNLQGFVHGGVLCSLLDTAMSRAFLGDIPGQHRSGATLELKVNFLKGVRNGRLTATGRLVSETRRTAFVEGEIRDDQNSLVARSSGTILQVDQR
ncbi:MAG: PaaI family thioesterase [Gammaproteobacteria bacterium]|nr:PaaI family thioesterase [Gammaproteobacteria bacterium]